MIFGQTATVFEIALVAYLLGAGSGFAVGFWFVKKRLESKVTGILDFGSDSSGDVEEIMDLSGVVDDD